MGMKYNIFNTGNKNEDRAFVITLSSSVITLIIAVVVMLCV